MLDSSGALRRALLEMHAFKTSPP